MNKTLLMMIGLALFVALPSPRLHAQAAPPQPYGTTLSALNGGSPNGQWDLFIQDESHFNTGVISNGWSVTITIGSPVGAVADLDLTVTNYVSTVSPGADASFYVGVTNYGVSTATNVVVTDSLPSGVTFLSDTASAGTVSQSGSQITWTVGNLAYGAGASLVLTMQAPTVLGPIIDSASAQSTTPIVNTADNSSTATVMVGNISAPQLGTVYTAANGTFTLNVNASTTAPTYIYASTNLVTWVPVFTNASPFVSPFTFTNSNISLHPYQFFKAVTGP